MGVITATNRVVCGRHSWITLQSPLIYKCNCLNLKPNLFHYKYLESNTILNPDMIHGQSLIIQLCWNTDFRGALSLRRSRVLWARNRYQFFQFSVAKPHDWEHMNQMVWGLFHERPKTTCRWNLQARQTTWCAALHKASWLHKAQ